MRKSIFIVLLPLLFFASGANRSLADVNVGITADQDGIKEFYLSVGTHYGVKERDIEKVRARSLPDDEMTVVFFLSNRLGIYPMTLVELRLDGMSWMEITWKYGLTAELYYVKYSPSPGPPYGNAWGHFNKTPRKEWSKIRLDDSDIVNLVNLKFLAEKYKYSPDEIIRMRKKGNSFAGMNGKFKKEKEAKEHKKAAAKKAAGNSAKGKKGKGKK